MSMGSRLADRAGTPVRRRFQCHPGGLDGSATADADDVMAPTGRKGIRFLFRNPVAEPFQSGPSLSARRGNPKRPGDAVGRSGESFLFSISVRVPWNPLAGR